MLWAGEHPLPLLRRQRPADVRYVVSRRQQQLKSLPLLRRQLPADVRYVVSRRQHQIKSLPLLLRRRPACPLLIRHSRTW